MTRIIAMFEGVDSKGQDGVWITDGTAAGTRELGISGSYGNTGGVDPSFPVTVLTAFRGEVLFEAYNAAGTRAGLWEADGTSLISHELTGITGANVNGINPSNATVFNSQVLFKGTNTAGNFGLWVTDGTSAGTHEVTGINGASTAQHLAAAGYRPLLVDKGDFGSGASARSSRARSGRRQGRGLAERLWYS